VVCLLLPQFFASHLPGIKDTTRYRNQQEAKCDLVLVGHCAVNRYLYNMKSIVITPKNKSEFEFVSSLVKKLGLASWTLSLEDKEDAGLGILMSQADRSSTVKKSTVLKNLQ
jgi:hypothetical protein